MTFDESPMARHLRQLTRQANQTGLPALSRILEGASQHALSRRLDGLGLRVRTRNALMGAGYVVLRNLCGLTDEALLSCDRFGVTSLVDLKRQVLRVVDPTGQWQSAVAQDAPSPVSSDGLLDTSVKLLESVNARLERVLGQRAIALPLRGDASEMAYFDRLVEVIEAHLGGSRREDPHGGRQEMNLPGLVGVTA